MPPAYGKKGAGPANGFGVLNFENVVVGKRYRLEQRLGGGAFGEVYRGSDLKTGRAVAFKMELCKDDARSHISLEHRVYRRLNECSVTVGIPQVYYCGSAGEYAVMVMDLLGPSLEALFNHCDRQFNLKTVCMLGMQIVDRLQYVHSCGYMHRDIKPENFVMGTADRSHIVYVIDVGLAKAWRDSTGRHIPYSEGKTLTGTARYVSINTHDGKQQSRRDDLESVTYLLMYFLRGSLPWQGLKSAKSDVRYERIRNVKASTTPAALATGFPKEFAALVDYARRLEFAVEPDYAYCRQLLRSAMGDEKLDFRYHWKPLPRRGNYITEDGSTTGTGARRSSGHNSAVATGGESVLMFDSQMASEADCFSAAPAFSQHLLSVDDQSCMEVMEDIHEAFGAVQFK